MDISNNILINDLLKAIRNRSEQKADCHVTFADLAAIVHEAKLADMNRRWDRESYKGNESEDTLEYPGAPKIEVGDEWGDDPEKFNYSVPKV